jgi:hypothetical protein
MQIMEELAKRGSPLVDDFERLLDTALEQTFPASDPIAVDVTPRTQPVPAGARQLP